MLCHFLCLLNESLSRCRRDYWDWLPAHPKFTLHSDPGEWWCRQLGPLEGLMLQETPQAYRQVRALQEDTGCKPGTGLLAWAPCRCLRKDLLVSRLWMPHSLGSATNSRYLLHPFELSANDLPTSLPLLVRKPRVRCPGALHNGVPPFSLGDRILLVLPTLNGEYSSEFTWHPL